MTFIARATRPPADESHVIQHLRRPQKALMSFSHVESDASDGRLVGGTQLAVARDMSDCLTVAGDRIIREFYPQILSTEAILFICDRR